MAQQNEGSPSASRAVVAERSNRYYLLSALGKLVAVFLISFLCLSFGVDKVRVAAAFPDPVSKIRAQDESLYGHVAMHMAKEGTWLTPVFLGRYLLYKPPLLAWLCGLSLKVFGVTLFGLRLPVLLAAAMAVTLVFSWLQKTRPNAPFAAVAGALLLVSNRLWHTFSRICQTDGLFAAWFAGAAFCVLRDPRLETRMSFAGFSVFAAAAIMTKSVAGLLLLPILIVFAVLIRDGQRPSPRRIVQAFLLVAALALPWHLYQFLAHPQWFWADYVQLQLLGFGLKPPSQVSAESHLVFYLKRLFLTDPILCLLAAVATPSFLLAVRRRSSAGGVLLFSWLAVTGAAILAFQYRNAHYLLPVIPALCLVAAGYGPLTWRGRQAALAGVLCAVFFLKANFPGRPWGLPFGEESPLQAARVLRDYYERGRANELILVSPDDEFYSAVLPLPQVRYCFIDPEKRTADYGPHFVYLGITVTAGQFIEMDRWRDIFRERLRDWGLFSLKPLATAIMANDEADIVRIIHARPHSDFYLPMHFRRLVEPIVSATHELVEVSRERFFLLSKKTEKDRSAVRSLPRHW